MRTVLISAGFLALAGCDTIQETTSSASEPQGRAAVFSMSELQPLLAECIKVVTQAKAPNKSLGKESRASVAIPPLNVTGAKRRCLVTMPNTGPKPQEIAEETAALLAKNGFTPASNPEISKKWKKHASPYIFSNGDDYIAVSGQKFSDFVNKSQLFFNLF